MAEEPRVISGEERAFLRSELEARRLERQGEVQQIASPERTVIQIAYDVMGLVTRAHAILDGEDGIKGRTGDLPIIPMIDLSGHLHSSLMETEAGLEELCNKLASIRRTLG